MEAMFSMFNSVSSFLYAVLLISGLACWCAVGIYRFAELCKTVKKGKNDSA